MIAPLVLVFLGARMGPIITPYRTQERLQARAVSPLFEKATTNLPLEFSVDLAATYDNPFDYDDINVSVLIEGPNNTSYRHAAFFTMDCERKLADGKEIVTKKGSGGWKARLSFPTAGTYKVSAIVKDRNGTSGTSAISVDVAGGASNSIVKVSERDHRYFETVEGKSFFPIGANICWGGDQGTFSYDTWLAKYAEQGVNYFRVWLNPAFFTFGLESKGNSRDGKGLGQLSLENLYRLDHVMGLARKYNMKVQLCVDSFNTLQSKQQFSDWENTPLSIANGGILHAPSTYWDNPVMDKFVQMKLRYLAARYASDNAVFAWEFWNELDLIDDFDSKKAQTWHQRMAKALRSYDPYGHMITTSFANQMGVKDVDMLPDMDFIQTHSYNSPDVIGHVAVQQSRKGSWGKPHIIGEIGADFAGPRSEDDPTGIQIHDPLWITIAMGSSGGASPWWWDNYIEPKNLYPLFGAATRFTEGIDWARQDFRQTQAKLAYKVKPAVLPKRDITLSGGATEWSAHPINVPKTLTVTHEGVKGPLPVAGLLHGVVNHRDCTNPITLICDLKTPVFLDVLVDSVSGYGGAKLDIELDYASFKSFEFADPDGDAKGDTLKNYTGVYTAQIPAGKHRVVIKNTGADWMTCSYRFRELVDRTGPPLVSWATVGESTALAWVRLEERTWQRVAALKENVNPSPASIFELPGLASGMWKLELWDTWKGDVTRTSDIRVGLDSKLRVELPAIATDLAIKATKK